MAFLFLLDTNDFSLCCGKTGMGTTTPRPGTRDCMENWRNVLILAGTQESNLQKPSQLVSIISNFFCHWWVRISLCDWGPWVRTQPIWGWGVGNSRSKHIYSNGKGADRQIFYKQMQIWDKALCFCFLPPVFFFPSGQEPFALPHLWTVSYVMLDGMWTWVGNGVPWGFGNTISGCAWWQCFQKR